jgi:WNK lysine deficient protein kinase
VFDERYSSKADVYSFGMCLLEMVTTHTPYRECGNNAGAVYRKIIQGIPPADINRIQNDKVRDFILLCLQPEELRPTAADLLQHEFLSDTSDEMDAGPVQLSEDTI